MSRGIEGPVCDTKNHINATSMVTFSRLDGANFAVLATIMVLYWSASQRFVSTFSGRRSSKVKARAYRLKVQAAISSRNQDLYPRPLMWRPKT